MKNITFTPEAFNEFNGWAIQDKKIYRKLITLVNDVTRQPFTELGKPEALKQDLKGYWSRRITEEHRLVDYHC